MLKIAFTSYEKVLVELRSALRGDEFDKEQFIVKMKVIDEMIIDQTPLADKYAKLYDKKYKEILYFYLIKYAEDYYKLCELQLSIM